jgi:hypothetical protein
VRTAPQALNFFLLSLLMRDRNSLILTFKLVDGDLFFFFSGQDCFSSERDFRHYNMSVGHGTEAAIVVELVNPKDWSRLIGVSGRLAVLC